MGSATATVREALIAARRRLPELFERGTRLVVAFSGGQDSTCLLHALHVLQPDLHLLAAHIDHGLRPDSANAAQHAVNLAESMGVAATSVRVDIAAQRRGGSVQAAARAARYRGLAAVVQEHHGRALLVAHTADDQAETVLLNLVRGTGLRGLSGMRMDETIDPHQLGPALPDLTTPAAVRVARPLLGVERATTFAYCAAIGLRIIEDASNQSRAYTRNRVRLDVLPLLEQFNPAIRGVLARTAQLAADDVAALDAVVEQLHQHLAQESAPGVLAYDRRAFTTHPRALQRRLLRWGLDRLLGTLVDVPAAPIEDALDVLASAKPGLAYHLPYGVELVTHTDNFELRRHGGARPRTARNTWGRKAPRV